MSLPAPLTATPPSPSFQRKLESSAFGFFLTWPIKSLDSSFRTLLSGIILGCPSRVNTRAVCARCNKGATPFLAATTSPARHPGAGRDPVAITPVQAIRLLDSGLRRNDERGCGIGTSHVEPQGSKLFRTAVCESRNPVPLLLNASKALGPSLTSPSAVKSRWGDASFAMFPIEVRKARRMIGSLRDYDFFRNGSSSDDRPLWSSSSINASS